MGLSERLLQNQIQLVASKLLNVNRACAPQDGFS